MRLFNAKDTNLLGSISTFIPGLSRIWYLHCYNFIYSFRKNWELDVFNKRYSNYINENLGRWCQKMKPYQICDFYNRIKFLSKRQKSIANRIFKNCKIESNGCWTWQGANSGKSSAGGGYGRISIDGYTSAVHRVMWICLNGYLPPKKQLDHTCRNRLCCNPDHLEPVTHKQNCKRRDQYGKTK